MLEVYWGCLVGGMLFSVVSLLSIRGGHGGHSLKSMSALKGVSSLKGAHHLLSHGAHHHGVSHSVGHADHGHHHTSFLNPTTIIPGIAAFGGGGILLVTYTTLTVGPQITLAIFAAVLMSVLVHFLFVRPMDRAEASVAFSIHDCVGRTGVITVPVPEHGHGQIMLNMGGSNTVQIAASFDQTYLPKALEAVVVEVREGILYVAKFSEEPSQELPTSAPPPEKNHA